MGKEYDLRRVKEKYQTVTVTKSKYKLRPNDLYETERWATIVLLKTLKWLGLYKKGDAVWEPSAGNHKIVLVLRKIYDDVFATDIAQYTRKQDDLFDFLSDDYYRDSPRNLITNPPYGPQNTLAVKYARRALERCDGYVCLLLTAKFDFGNTRHDLFRDNKRFLGKIVLVDRISWVDNGKTGTEDHAWYIWGPKEVTIDKPRIIYKGKPDAKRRKKQTCRKTKTRRNGKTRR